jgi:hypothetical protein
MEQRIEELERKNAEYFKVICILLSIREEQQVQIGHSLLSTFNPSMYNIEVSADFLACTTVLKLVNKGVE